MRTNRFLIPFLTCLFLSITWTLAKEASIDEAIVAAETKSSDAEELQPDHTILTESDMRFTPEQWKALNDLRDGNGRNKRNALKNLQSRWTNGVVPYSISGSFSGRDMSAIRSGLNEWNKFSCVNIRPATRSDRNSINVVPNGGCSSMVGMTGRRGQTLTLGNGCRYKGIVAHEFGHALGFHHEQTRPDRDNYVRIIQRNINSQMLFNFRKYDWNMINAYNVPYDYESVMHYGQYAFSTNRQRTIETRDPKFQTVIGNRYGISFSDIKLINLMYSCNERCPKKQCPGSGFVGKDCKCWCKGPTIKQPAVYCDTKQPVSGGNSIGPTPTRPTTSGKIDRHVNCAQWARRGDCRRNAAYMKMTCARSCANATGGSRGSSRGSCRDTHGSCSYWKSQGYCNNMRFRAAMHGGCKASCGLC